MKWITLLLLFHHTLAQFYYRELDQLSSEKKCVLNHRTSENMWEQRLVEDLLKCGYDSFKPPPPNGTQPLEVSAFFIMKNFKFDSELQQFSTFMWTCLTWKDERLKWDPTKYDGIQKVLATTIQVLWAPNIRLINNIADILDERYLYVPCELESDGTVTCINWIDYQAKCITDLRDWPYDAQHCSMEFGLYSAGTITMRLDVASKAISMVGAEYGSEWDLMDYQQTTNLTSEKELVMKFKLERHAAVLAAIVVHPALVLSILTFSSLLIDARLNLRLLVICFSLFCHNYAITDLSFKIPDNTKDPPKLLMYYRGSFVLTSLLLVVSFVFNIICRKEAVCPSWMISINDFVLIKYGKLVVWPRWETKMKENIGASNSVQDWTDFANIINTVWLFVSIAVYVSLYCVFMPQPIPY